MLTNLDYAVFTKSQKLAAFMILVGPEAAPELIRQFTEADVEAIVHDMAAMELIDMETQDKVMEEFCALIGEGMSTVLGGLPFAQRALERAKGTHSASNILQRAIPASNSVEAVRELSQMEGRQIYNLIKAEQPQTIAFVLSYLDTAKAVEIITLFPPHTREDVVERIGTMETTNGELVGRVLKNLNKHLDTKGKRQTLHKRGGVAAVAQMLNSLEKELSKSLLAKIEERNSSLGEAIRKKMFSFEDLARLSSTDLQRILRDVDSNDLAISLKSARESVRRAIYGSMSKRAAEGLKEEIELLGPMRVKDVEAAQDRIIAVVRNLEEQGEVTIQQDEDEIIN